MKTLKTNRKIVLVIGLFATLFLATQVSQAQVKIGEDTAPAKGAVLDLSNSSSGYVGGLKLPNVSITSLTAIPTTFKEFSSGTPTTAEKTALTGTLVYNTNTTTGVGIYYWDGTKWVVQATSGGGNVDAWLTQGNSGTNPTNNFVGTLDNQPLVFRINNTVSGKITNGGITSFGYNALKAGSGGLLSCAFGDQALSSIGSSFHNNAFGNEALKSNTIGGGNNAFGYRALYSNVTGNYNVAVGKQALNANTGSYNTAVGNDAGLNITIGENNTIIGNNAGNSLTTGSYNIAIGGGAQVPTATASNQLSIGNWIYGVNGNIGIGTSAPTEKLQVNGKVKIVDGTQGDAKVLTSDANGVGTWQALSFGNKISTWHIEANPKFTFTSSTQTLTGNSTLTINEIPGVTVGTNSVNLPAGRYLAFFSGDIGDTEYVYLYFRSSSTVYATMLYSEWLNSAVSVITLSAPTNLYLTVKALPTTSRGIYNGETSNPLFLTPPYTMFYYYDITFLQIR